MLEKYTRKENRSPGYSNTKTIKKTILVDSPIKERYRSVMVLVREMLNTRTSWSKMVAFSATRSPLSLPSFLRANNSFHSLQITNKKNVRYSLVHLMMCNNTHNNNSFSVSALHFEGTLFTHNVGDNHQRDYHFYFVYHFNWFLQSTTRLQIGIIDNAINKILYNSTTRLY